MKGSSMGSSMGHRFSDSDLDIANPPDDVEFHSPHRVGYLKHKAQLHTSLAIDTVADIMVDPAAPHQARLAAAREMLDRGHGRPEQTHIMEAGQSLIGFLRQIAREREQERDTEHRDAIIDLVAEDANRPTASERSVADADPDEDEPPRQSALDV